MNIKKIVSISINVILISIILLLGYVQISMLVTKNKNFGVPQVFGKSFLYVATDSMENKDDPNCLAPGTGIIIEKVNDLSSLEVAKPIYDKDDDGNEYIKDYDTSTGDVVTFYLTSKKVPDTHRLIYKNYDESTGVYTFRTMGDNPEAHIKHKYEEWTGDLLIGKVIYHSKGLGDFLSIASPEAAHTAGKQAWFFPVAIITPIVILAVYYIVDAFIKYHKENQEREKKIQEAMVKAGIDLNDEEAVELFRMKEEIRLDYQEEYEKIKKKIRKEIENQKNEKK